VLDPGGFGALTITKSIMINGGGELASVLVSGTNGIVINAGPNDTVILRNLELTGLGTGLNGILFQGGGKLIVDHCTIQGFTGNGIEIASSGNGSVIVQDSTIIGGNYGVTLDAGATGVFASMKNVTIEGSVTALHTKAGFIGITNSVIDHNSSYGALTETGIIDIESSLFEGNGTAVQANTGSAIRISNVDIFNNIVGIGSGGGTVNSAGNNRKIGNVTPGAPNGTIGVQ
jgi:hypothetical protein